MRKIKIKHSDAMAFMGSIGNVGYLWNFIDYFEKKLPEEIAPYPEDLVDIGGIKYPYGECPNFAAWVRLYVEAICNKILGSIARAKDFEKSIADIYFGPALKEIFAIGEKECLQRGIPKTESKGMAKALKIVVELRHTLQHGGMPNILRELKYKEVTIEDLAAMMAPQRYKKTKEIFQSANKLLQLLPQPIMVSYQNGTVILEKPDKD
jgi:hypothetical protein